MNNFYNGFADELIKEAKYPISRFLTHRAGSGAMDAVGHAAAGTALGPAAAVGGLEVALQSLRRGIGGRALHGRLVRGGKGLMGHEKKKLAETLGVSVPEVEKIIARYAAKHRGGKTHPVSRALSTKYNPIAIPRRILDTRAMAGRAAAGGKGMTKREREIVKVLRGEKTQAGRIKALKTIGVASSGLALGGALAS